ncbi:hypothetical protein SSX86_028621 [Deinandra increscens subsp. villosa]|uniref:QWRF motif-containing protein 7 n=1 Tax=Deinandra increscens subsp. villosa TaxID=3103831 RepID=A0AAP0CB42_9ASTR
MISDQTRRQKSREVSSRYLSSTAAPPSPPPLVLLNHNNTLSPNHPNQKPKQKQKHKHTGFIRGLWPSSASKLSDNNNDNQPISAASTLADHLGNERRKHGKHGGVKRSENSPVLSKQRSCSESTKNNLKELYNYTPIFGGRSSSMRFGGKLISPGRTSTSSSFTRSSDHGFDSNQDVILPGRLSVDENALRRRSSYQQTRSDSFSDNSENSDLGNYSPFTGGRNSPASYMAPTLSSKKSGIDVQSKLHISPPIPMQYNSPKNVFTTKRANPNPSSSPLRFGSPKPPTSSRGKKNLLHIGLDLIKGKKGDSKLSSNSPLGSDHNAENVHQLRLMQNSWMQWRYANARAQHVHQNLAAQSENTLLYGYVSLAKLRQSVVQKRLQLQKEKQEMKLNLILQSQVKLLEAWGDIERRHILDVSVMTDYLHAVVCMIPLVEGAKVDIGSATMAFQQTSHLVATIKSMLSSISPPADETMVKVSELAEIVSQEKLLLEECFEQMRIISTLEIEERNLRCSIIAMESSAGQQQQKQHMFM